MTVFGVSEYQIDARGGLFSVSCARSRECPAGDTAGAVVTYN
jgi:hypothetical protein